MQLSFIIIRFVIYMSKLTVPVLEVSAATFD